MLRNVRKAALNDIPALCGIALAVSEETESSFPFSPVFFSSMLAVRIEEPNSDVLVFQGKNVLPVAFLVYKMQFLPTAPVLIGYEEFFGCLPEERGTGALSLFRAFEQDAAQRGAKELHASVYGGRSAERFFARNNYEHLTTSWRKVL